MRNMTAFQPIVERPESVCIIIPVISAIKNLVKTPVLFRQTLIVEL